MVQLQGHGKTTRFDSAWQINEFSLQHCSKNNVLSDCKERLTYIFYYRN